MDDNTHSLEIDRYGDLRAEARRYLIGIRLPQKHYGKGARDGNMRRQDVRRKADAIALLCCNLISGNL